MIIMIWPSRSFTLLTGKALGLGSGLGIFNVKLSFVLSLKKDEVDTNNFLSFSALVDSVGAFGLDRDGSSMLTMAKDHRGFINVLEEILMYLHMHIYMYM